MTVRHFLSFLALRTTPEFELTEDAIKGVDWRSSANSSPGNVENVTVPTLVMAGTCAIHLVPLGITFDHSVAKDKEFVAVEGANHRVPTVPAGIRRHAQAHVRLRRGVAEQAWTLSTPRVTWIVDLLRRGNATVRAGHSGTRANGAPLALNHRSELRERANTVFVRRKL